MVDLNENQIYSQDSQNHKRKVAWTDKEIETMNQQRNTELNNYFKPNYIKKLVITINHTLQNTSVKGMIASIIAPLTSIILHFFYFLKNLHKT